MRVVKPLVIIEDDLSMLLPNGLTMGQHMIKKTEMFTRKCYKSEESMSPVSHQEFLPRVYGNGARHAGIAEHRLVSVTFITDRGVSHEGVRHRMAAYLQESTRYCDYSNKGITYIQPPWMKTDDINWEDFVLDLQHDEAKYNKWRRRGWKPEEARYHLPNGLKTEYVASLNLGSWHNFFAKRACNASGKAHPSMRQVAIPALRYFQTHLPELFGKLEIPPFEYEEAELIVNPYYEQVEFTEVWSNGS